jgi:hypothetical protein
MRRAQHPWAFTRRFRAGAFGWKSEPAITRVKEAVAEIRKVARKDPALGAEGAVVFLEKVSHALEHVDGSSGAIGTAVNHAVETFAALIAKAPVDDRTRGAWLERLWSAYTDDAVPYIDRLGDQWGALCASPARAARWADLLLDVLETAPFVWWNDRQWGVRALAALGRVDDAVAYAHASLGRGDGPGAMASLCEELLLAAGRADQAYRDYAIAANQGASRLATFRAIAAKYPHKDTTEILRDLIDSTPGDEGQWFATAKELGLRDLALVLAQRSPCDPKTLNRAARDHMAIDPRFANEVALASLHWLAEGRGYEITGLDVLAAYDAATRASQVLRCSDATRARIRALVEGDHSPGAFVRQVLGPRLDLV